MHVASVVSPSLFFSIAGKKIGDRWSRNGNFHERSSTFSRFCPVRKNFDDRFFRFCMEIAITKREGGVIRN